jgi:hypothetical protein
MGSIALAALLGGFIYTGFCALAWLADHDTIWERLEAWANEEEETP